MDENPQTPLLEMYEVFVRSKRGMDHYHVGSVRAADHEQALVDARDCYIRRGEGTSIWVVRSADIVCSQASDVSSFYDPMHDKRYRHATHYEVPKGAKNI